MRRIESKVDEYTGPWQHGMKSQIGCADIVWCQKILASVVLRKKWKFYKMSIDMSRAYDTIKRKVILNLLKDAGCTEDEIRIVNLLLTNTKLTIRINKTKSEKFETTLGSFQGDALSGKLFTLYLAGALNHLRATIERPNPPIGINLLPMETEYVDDCDFIDESKEKLEELLPQIEKVFNEWNLKVNPNKTEFTDIYVSEDAKERGNEIWRTQRVLGSKLCSTKDILNRIILANAAFQKYKKVWIQGTKLNSSTKVRVYEAMVVPVFLYNSCTWAAPKNIFEKLDSAHRKHLREILNIRWPEMISNETLYARCKLSNLSCRVTKYRWTMLGNVLRQEETKPTVNALFFALDKAETFPTRRGRPVTNFLDMIKSDLEAKGFQLQTTKDIEILREKALNEKSWNKI